MALPISTAYIDPETNSALPLSQTTWASFANVVAWSGWRTWNAQPANSMVVVSSVQDRGVTGYFNIRTTADVTGNIAYSVYTSNSGAFAGEETISNITPNTSNIGAFYGRYFVVAATVSDLSGQIQLRSLNIESTNNRFDIQFNDVDTQNLSAGPDSGTKILPLSRTISAVTNMQVTAHNPVASSATYMPTGNGPTGYIVNYTGPSTTLSNIITSSNTTVEYLAMAVEETSIGVKVYKTIDGQTYDTLANLANASNTGSTVTWNSTGTRLVAGFRTSNDYNNLRWYSRSGDTFTKLNDPDVWPVNWVRQVAFSPDDSYLAVGHDDSPYISIYNASTNNLSKLSDPASLPTGEAYGVAWDPTGTYLAVAHGASPYLTIYKRSGNTFTKLANPSILPTTGTTAGTAVAWHPDGTYLAWGGEYGPDGTGRVRIYFRSGDTFAMVTTANIDLGNTLNTPYALNYNATGTHLAIGASGDDTWLIYNQSGNTVANTSIAVSSGIGPTWQALDWNSAGSKLFRGHSRNAVNPRGMDIYNVAYSGTGNANITLTSLSGVSSNVGNVKGVSSYTTTLGAYIEVANAAIFSGAGGNIRINNESLSYVTANVTPTPNRLEGITRGITTAEFGTSTANIHSAGSEVFPIEQLDFTARYFAEETIGITHAYIANKDRVNPTIIVRDAEGTTADTTVDAVIWALPEQYMDTVNLNTR